MKNFIRIVKLTIRGIEIVNYLMHTLIATVDIIALIACLRIKSMDALLYIHMVGMLFISLIVVIPHKCFNRLDRT